MLVALQRFVGRDGGVVGLSLAVGLLAVASVTSAQTVNDIAARGACSTAGVEGISAQLAEAQMCLRPDAFVRFAPHEGITLTSSRVHPYVQASSRDAIWAAAARTPLQVNSAFRTLADQYVLYHSGGCGLAAPPGSSNHQTGRAIDVQNYSGAKTALQNAGCSWLGSRDPVHFDCPGSDGRSDAVLAFQKLWNINNPGERILEDGVYGPMTESALGRSPAAGFPRGGCACTPGCDGGMLVAEDCSRTECAAGTTCDPEMAACVAPPMAPDGGMMMAEADAGIAPDAGVEIMEGDAGPWADAGPTWDEGEARGVSGGCSVTAGTSGAPWWALLIAGMLVGRARRRRR